MKKLILFILLTVAAISAFSQIIVISDLESKKPVENVVILGQKPAATAITNSDGQADISGFKECSSIEIRCLGYKSIITDYPGLNNSGFSVYLERIGVSLDAIVISATKWRQPSNNVPGMVVTIPTRDVELQNPQTAADLLASSGKVFIQKSQQGGGSPMIRGFATNRLLYSVDGVRMNTAIFRSGNIQNVISLDPLAIESTEVCFGPGSVMYGSDAIGGVMSFQTLTPQLSMNDKTLTTGKVLARYASANNELTAHLDVNTGWKKWALLSSVTSSDFGDLKMGSYGPGEYLRPFYVQRQDSTDMIVTNDNPKVQRPSGYSQINMMEKLRIMPNNNWDIQYGFHYSVTSDYSRYDRQIRYKNGLPRYGEWSYGPQKWMMNNLSVCHTSNNVVYDQMTIHLAEQFFEESRYDRDFNKSERHIRIEKVNAYSGNIDFNKSIGEKHHLLYGVEVVYNDVASTGTDEDISTGGSAPGPSRYPQSTWSSYAVYLCYQANLSEKVSVQAGARYNYYSLHADFDTTFYPFPFTVADLGHGAVTGNAGFVYKPAPTWAINLNLATGFRSPNVDDVGKVFDAEAGSVVVPNPGLKAEYAYSGEIGIAKVFHDVVKIDATAYYTFLDDAMVRRDYTLNGLDSIVYDGQLSQVQAIQNAAFAYVFGIQAGFEMKLPLGLGFSSDFNYQAGTEELDDGTLSPSRHAPPWIGISRLTYSRDRVTVQLNTVYSGQKKYEDLAEEEKGKPEIYAIDADGNPYSPGWYTLNFKAMVQVTEFLFASAGIENITDQRYRPYSSGIAGAGRNFILSLTARF